jgi:hypothetical protein
MSETATMRFVRAIDTYIAEQQADGRINSPNTERMYRDTLSRHAEDVDNRDPAYTNRDDVKRTLARWDHPNTRSKNRSVLVSFYDWMVEEGTRPNNPARQTKRPRRRKSTRYKLTRAEALAMLHTASGTRERRAIYLGVCAGLRRWELRGMQGRHFRRPGWVWVSADIGKGGKERWIPVITDLEPIWEDLATLADDEYALPAQRFRDPRHQQAAARLRPLPRVRAGDLAAGEGRGGQGVDPGRHLHAHPPARLLRPRRPPRRASVRPAGDGPRRPRDDGAVPLQPPPWTSSRSRCAASRSAPSPNMCSRVGSFGPQSRKRRRPDLNRCTRLCRPLRNPSATAPGSGV